MYKYRLYYLADGDDLDPKFYETELPVTAGDVIRLPETGFFHQAIRLLPRKTNTRINVSKSAQSEEEARLLAIQYEHWPPAPSRCD